MTRHFHISLSLIRVAFLPLLLCATVLVCGCSDHSADSSWYDSAVSSKEEKEDYIESQVELGIDRDRARQNYERNEIILRTEGRTQDLNQ